jgi:hypothetical protein
MSDLLRPRRYPRLPCHYLNTPENRPEQESQHDRHEFELRVPDEASGEAAWLDFTRKLQVGWRDYSKHEYDKNRDQDSGPSLPT